VSDPNYDPHAEATIKQIANAFKKQKTVIEESKQQLHSETDNLAQDTLKQGRTKAKIFGDDYNEKMARTKQELERIQSELADIIFSPANNYHPDAEQQSKQIDAHAREIVDDNPNGEIGQFEKIVDSREAEESKEETTHNRKMNQQPEVDNSRREFAARIFEPRNGNRLI
jgi:hypothetical protein